MEEKEKRKGRKKMREKCNAEFRTTEINDTGIVASIPETIEEKKSNANKREK